MKRVNGNLLPTHLNQKKKKSSAPEKEESSSNSSEPKIMMSSSDPSLIIPEVSASTSASEMRFKYDVFLSFRDELVKIMECQKMTGHTAYPVFFDVEPTQVRKQSGAVKDAFAEHEKKEAAGKKYSTLSNADETLVGMEIRISDVLSSLKIGTEDVRMIGIKGIGGGGKTTLARAVYDQISNHFEGKSFVENVRAVSKSKLSGLTKLQKQILKDVLNKEDFLFSTLHDGKNMLKDTMSRRKILLVLDDVDCKEQLEALAGQLNWFKSGSRIIITTRDEQVLSSHRVKFVHSHLVLPREAIFGSPVWHAFTIKASVLKVTKSYQDKFYVMHQVFP
ncbi:Toll/interleukin-1 receptor domain-containing protein [Tanacetum coccineum]